MCAGRSPSPSSRAFSASGRWRNPATSLPLSASTKGAPSSHSVVQSVSATGRQCQPEAYRLERVGSILRWVRL